MLMLDTSNDPKLPKYAGRPLGESGTVITGGIISLEEYNRKLVGRSALQQYDIMRRSDSSIRGLIQVVMLPLLSAKWAMQPAHIDEKDPEAKSKQERADYKARFINRELFHRSLNFNDLIKSLMGGALQFGFDVEEKIFELTEFEKQVRVGISKIDKRKQTTILQWQMPDGSPGVRQVLIGKTVDIPMPKLIVFSHDKEGDNYEGISLLRYVYKDWDIKDKLTIVNAIAIEQLATGVPVIEEKEGQSASEPDKAKAIETVSNFRANEQRYMMMPSSLGVAMLDMKSSTTKEVIPTLNYHDSRISKSILAGFLEIGGHAGSGSQALAKDLTSLFMKSEEALGNLVISCLQDQLIKQLCDFNFSDMSEGYPQLTVSNIADDDVAVLASATSALVTSGAVTPEATLEDHLREIMGFPKLPQEIKDNYPVKTPPTDPAAAPANPDKPTPTDPKAKDKKDLPTEKESKTKAALAEAHRARRRLISELVG